MRWIPLLFLVSALLSLSSSGCKLFRSDQPENWEIEQQRIWDRDAYYNATPVWARRAGYPLALPKIRLPTRGELFNSATPRAETPRGEGLMLCRIDMSPGERHDSVGRRAEVYVDVRLPGDYITRRAVELDRAHPIMSFPGIGVPADEPISIAVFDRDIGRDDVLGRVELAFDGTSVERRAMGSFDLECRFADPSRVAAEYAAATTHAHEALAALAAAGPAPSTALHESAQSAISEMAAYVGWPHPDVRAVLEKYVPPGGGEGSGTSP